MMIVSTFSIFFTIEKREPLQHVFLYTAPQSAINRISTSTPRSTLNTIFLQTPLLCQHYTLMPHTYRYRKHITLLQSVINPITRYSSYTKLSFFTQHHPHIDFTPHRQHSSVAPPCHNTACFVTARLAVQLNGIVQNHSTCHYVATTHCIFPKPSSITLIVATVFSKTVAHNSYRLIYTSVFSE